MQSLVRVFFDDNEVKGWVIPDYDAELDEHHKSLINAPHTYMDLTNAELNLCRTGSITENNVGGVDKFKLHDFIKARK